MLNCQFENLFLIDPQHGITEAEWLSTDELLDNCYNNFLKKNQGFNEIIYDQAFLTEISQSDIEENNIIVIGIGGSALGTICIKNALKFKSKKQLTVIDNIDPDQIAEIETSLDYNNCHFIVISKSGETLETLLTFEYFKEKVLNQGLKPQNKFTLITNPKNGYLRSLKKKGYNILDIPENLGGRFSVLSSVSMYPAKLLGLKVEEFINGAIEMDQLFKSKDTEKNIPFQLAKTQFLLYQKGKKINVMMPYSYRLKTFADWFKQLIAESTGKNEFTGITPQAALGATDQHSQNQLYNEGPNDKLITFISVKEFSNFIEIPGKDKLTFNKFIKIAKKGTERALTQRNRPNISIEVEKVDEYNLGQLFYLFEASTAFLGELLGVNAFDQPGVELSKKITKSLLKTS